MSSAAPKRRARATTPTNNLALIAGRRWAISDEGRRTLLEAAHTALPSTRPEPRALSAEEGEYRAGSWMTTVRKGVARIRIRGPLFCDANVMSWWYGWTTYEDIAREFRGCLNDAAITTIVFDIDSPGGDVFGLSELAAMIYEARGVKTIVTFVNGYACSAAYWLATAASRVIASNVAMLGCIGTMWSYYDTSELERKIGIEEITVISSQTPNKNLDPKTREGRAELQALADELADVFIDALALYMAVTREKVLADFGRGSVLIGATAVAAGMAHEVSTYETLIAQLSDGSGTGPSVTSPAIVGAANTNAEIRMTKLKETPAPAATAEEQPKKNDEQDPAAAAEPVDEEEEEEKDPQAKAIAAAKASERDRIKRIRALSGPKAVIEACVEDPDCTPEAAAYKILTANAEKGGSRLTALRTDDAGAHASAAAPAAPVSESAKILADYALVNPKRSR